MNRFSRPWMIALFAGTLAASARAADPAEPTDNRQELDKVRAQIAAVQEALDRQAKDLLRLQHDLEYNNPEVAGLYRQVKNLEQQLLSAREQLKVQVSLVPEVKALERQRKQSFRELEGLRETERQLAAQVARETEPPASAP